VQKFYHLKGDERCLLRRLCHNAIAGDKCTRDLAGEDRQRKIPRADARDRAERRAQRVVARTKRDLLADFELKDSPTFVETLELITFLTSTGRCPPGTVTNSPV
jgi:hypothetical protein